VYFAVSLPCVLVLSLLDSGGGGGGGQNIQLAMHCTVLIRARILTESCGVAI